MNKSEFISLSSFVGSLVMLIANLIFFWRNKKEDEAFTFDDGIRTIEQGGPVRPGTYLNSEIPEVKEKGRRG